MTMNIPLPVWVIVPLLLTLVAIGLIVWSLWKEDAPELAQLTCLLWFTHVAVSLMTAAVLWWGTR